MARRCAAPGCEKELPEGSRAKTCSAACRQKLKRHRDTLQSAPETTQNAVAAIETGDALELALEVMKQELTPVVREAITEDTVKAIAGLVKLTPQLIESLAQDLTNPDPVARGRAQTLIAKYTMGRVDSKNEDRTAPININLGGIPTPDGDHSATVALGADQSDTVALRTCERCEEEYPETDFEPGADRCNFCQRDIKQGILARYAPEQAGDD